jgi:LPS export ABC transporter protein LptC
MSRGWWTTDPPDSACLDGIARGILNPMRAVRTCPPTGLPRGLTISWLFLLVGCRAGHPELPPDPNLPAGTWLRDVEVVEFSGDRKLWDLRADRVHIAPGTERAAVRTTEARFWSSTGPVSRLRAPEASFEAGTKTLVLKGKVVGEALDRPIRLTAGELTCATGQGTMEARGGVVLVRDRDRLEAPSMRADLSLQRVTLGPPVHARLELRISR